MFDHYDAYGLPASCEQVNEAFNAARKLLHDGNEELTRLRAAATRAERDESQAITERDDYHEIADKLADAIARLTGAEIGEHSSANDPWQNALDAVARAEQATAEARRAYELKVADFAKETARVEKLARVLLDDNHSPEGFHAQGDRCRHCKALREALRPDEALAADVPAAAVVPADPHTTEARLCDDDGMVSDQPVSPPNAFNPTLTYRQQLNNLRAATQGGQRPYEGGPFACTGSAHLAAAHIRCTSPAHSGGTNA